VPLGSALRIAKVLSEGEELRSGSVIIEVEREATLAKEDCDPLPQAMPMKLVEPTRSFETKSYSSQKARSLLRPVAPVSNSEPIDKSTSTTKNCDSTERASMTAVGASTHCYSVNFTRDLHKKRRAYSCGVLRVHGGKASLFSDEGKSLVLGKTVRISEILADGAQIKSGTTLIEIERGIPPEDFVSGRAFAQMGDSGKNTASSKLSRSKRGSLLCHGSNSPRLQESVVPPGALVLREPNIYLEPSLTNHLRPHQEEGVRFMFKHLLDGGGCILADSMGLGKSLQALCVVWVALSRPAGRPLSKKAAVVCPASLCGNWEAEMRKWLGCLRVRPTVVQGGCSAHDTEAALNHFLRSEGSVDGRVLIISYDQLRQHADRLDDSIDLLVCDEGHRLKSGAASTTKRLNALKCCRRILLTGTPLQNSLDEFMCCCNFVQPNLLPKSNVFHRVFKHPIERAQDESASSEEVSLGTARSAELTRMTNAFILRRGPEILEALLPKRTELLLTVPLTVPQVAVYRNVCDLRRTACHGDGNALQLLGLLRQLCNDPHDLWKKCSGQSPLVCDDDGISDDGVRTPVLTGFLELCQQAFSLVDPAVWELNKSSTKLRLLDALLRWVLQHVPGDGIVIVSNYQQSLTRCEELCMRHGFTTFLLTGATNVAKRVDLVDEFNRKRGPRAFLLSAKAGGVGLNIVGANRLVLLEPDWNPAIDLQAMGRVWRQGQEKPVFLYRLATYGTVEEKILQRQARKQGLAVVMVNSANANEMQAGNWEDLRKVYCLEGYAHDGTVLPGLRHTADVDPASGLCDEGVCAELHGVRILSVTSPRESTESNVHVVSRSHPKLFSILEAVNESSSEDLRGSRSLDEPSCKVRRTEFADVSLASRVLRN